MARRTYRGLTAEERESDRRGRLLAAGREIAGTSGYGAMTIEAACRTAGVTARNFYDHFAGREQLLVAVYESILDEHRGAVAAALADEPADALEPRVRTAVRAALETWIADPAAARIAFLEVVGTSDAVEARRRQAIAEYVELVVGIADDLHRAGLAGRPGNPIAGRAIVGALIGLVELWLGELDPPPTALLVDEATRIALGALTD